MVPVEHLLAEPLPEAGSADVKNAILIAGLNTAGETTVLEARPGRDVAERLLGHFGADVRVSHDATGRRRTTVIGWPELAGQVVAVPADPGAVALVSAVAASLPGSDVTVPGVLLDEQRRTFYRLLQDMGAEVAAGQTRESGSGPMADVRIRGAALHGIAVLPAQAVALQDDYPLLAVAAACARGTTRLPGAGDRSTVLAGCLQASGVGVTADADGLAVRGAGEAPPGGARLTMSRDLPGALSVLGLGLVGRAAMIVDTADLPCRLSGLVAALQAVQARIATA
jgi:3-phosphoshikimate 1-carboxyvinyltransferase